MDLYLNCNSFCLFVMENSNVQKLLIRWVSIYYCKKIGIDYLSQNILLKYEPILIWGSIGHTQQYSTISFFLYSYNLLQWTLAVSRGPSVQQRIILESRALTPILSVWPIKHFSFLLLFSTVLLMN